VSEEPSDDVRELAAKLFAAGRAERPGPALGRRLLLIQPPAAAGKADMVSTRSSEGRELTRERAAVAGHSRWAVGLAALAFAAGGFGIWLSSAAEPKIRISAERGARHAEGIPRAPSGSAGVAGALEARAGSEAVASALASREGAARDVDEGAARDVDEGAARDRAVAPRGSGRSAPAGSRGGAPRRAEGKAARGASGSSVAKVSPAAAPTSMPPSESTGGGVPMALTEELALLRDARAALRSHDAHRALELIERHAAARTGDRLLAEATLLRIEALAALGRRDEASALAERFVRDNPHSALSDRATSFIANPARTAP
jgi:hypothetical protein